MNHDHAARLNYSPFMKIKKIMADDDVMVVVHGYLAGEFAGKNKCITSPSDVKGLQTRAAGKALETMLVGAGASIHQYHHQPYIMLCKLAFCKQKLPHLLLSHMNL